MADPNFEKQVQQKMEELTFSPSDAVWEKVDAEINKERKRRIPFFWLFFFAGLTVAGGIYFLSVNKKDKSIVATTTIQKNQLHETKKEETLKPLVKAGIKVESSDTKKESPHYNSSTEKNTENIISLKPSIKHQHVNNEDETSSVNTNLKNNIKYQKSSKQSGNKNVLAENEEKNHKGTNNKNLHSETIEKDIEATDNNKNIDEKNNSISSEVIDSTGIAKQQNKKIGSSKNEKPIVLTEKPAANDSVNNKAIVKNNKKTKTNSRWKFGAFGIAGVSDIKQNLFKSAYVSNQNTYSAATNSGGTTTPGNTYTSSTINPGFSFSAGLFAKKLFSQRLSFSAGFNYHYYSTTIKIGSYSANASYVYSPNLTSIPVSNYYSSGNSNTYINHYHFIELPLLIGFQLNKNKKLPIYWEAGFTGSYLINTDALHFDRVTGVYYKKNDLFNKMQASAVTGLMIGFPVHGNILEIGPQLNYGLTRLLNKSTGNREHLFFAGLKVSTTFGKK